MTILNLAQLQLKAMPPGWSIQLLDNLGRDHIIEEYFLEIEPEVKFHYFCRSKPLSKIVADDFAELLAKAPHALSDDEFSHIEMVVRDASEPEFFETLEKRIDAFGGRNALVVDGVWKFSDLRDLGIFVPGNSDGKIDELHFTAPIELFDSFKTQLHEILSLMEWCGESPY